MSCNCEDSGQGNTQRNLVAWVQPSSSGPLNLTYYAMTAKDWPAVKITGMRKNKRGARTPMFRRSGDNPNSVIRVGSRVAAPAANTITVEFSNGGCGGFMPDELVNCELDIYQQHLCCDDGGDFTRGWSKIDVFAGVDFESDEYSDGVSYNPEDDNELFIRHTAEFRDKLTVYSLVTNEIAAVLGIDTGSTVTDVAYVGEENCGNGGCGREQSCTDAWYAVTNEGTVIYKGGRNLDITSVAIGAYPASTDARIAVLSDRVFVAFRDSGGSQSGYYWADLDESGDPGSWTRVNLTTAAQLEPQGWLHVSNKLWLFGQSNSGGSPLAQARVYQISRDTSFDTLLASAVNNTGIFDMDVCGSTKVGVGQNGTIWYTSDCQNTFALAPSAPTASDILTVAVRVPGEWWVGDIDGHVWYTTDSGESWTEKTFPFTAAGTVQAIRWANRNVGYVVSVVSSDVTVYSTWNGGESWTAEDPRFQTQASATSAIRMAVPCCTNQIEASNGFLLAGAASSVGGVWQATPRSC